MATPIETGTTELLAALDDGVLTLTMNRPEARNAMTGTMTAALADALAACRARSSRAVHRAHRLRRSLQRRRRRQGDGGER